MQIAMASLADCSSARQAVGSAKENSFNQQVDRMSGPSFPPVIYTLVRKSDWSAAEQKGQYTGSADDVADGFLHFSTAAQVRESARRHRSGETDLLLVAVDVAPLGKALKWERSASRKDVFPHLYDALKTSFVLSVRPLPLGTDGLHVFPDEILVAEAP